MTATFTFTADAFFPDDPGVDIDLLTAPPIAPADFGVSNVNSTTNFNPLLVTSLDEIDTFDYALHGAFAIHRTGTATPLGNGFFSSTYTETVDVGSSKVSSIIPFLSFGQSVQVEFSAPVAYSIVAGKTLGQIAHNGDTLIFTDLADHVKASDAGETIKLGAGNDWVLARGGADSIDGGDGLDTSSYAGNHTGYIVAHVGSGFTVAAGGVVDTLVNVERLEFADGRIALDVDGTNGAGAAYRIYQAAFDRTPDVGGLTYWTEQADKQMSTIEMSARFIDSDEFRHLYGSSNLPADTFVTQVYENVLHRAGEQGGVNYWVGQIHGGMSEAEVLARFADSPENRADVIGVIGNGILLNVEGDYAS